MNSFTMGHEDVRAIWKAMLAKATPPEGERKIDTDLDEILTEAINIIDNEAQVLFESNTDTDGNWGTEPIDIEAKKDYDELRAFACRIDDKRAALRSPQREPKP